MALGLAWVALSLVLGLASGLVSATASGHEGLQMLDWQPTLALTQPWRALTAAWVHWNTQHLLLNIAGTGVVAALGWAARLPMVAALAWLAAWPLTHALLLLLAPPAHYGGLSGVLHAGTAVAAWWLLIEQRGARRWIGAAILMLLGAKLASETQAAASLLSGGGAVVLAPMAHVAGAVAGTISALVGLGFVRAARGRTDPRTVA